MDVLRFITAGSVDDGKSTLIGRLLLDTGNIKADVLESISIDKNAEINLAHIADGLRAERQQGITIDVAYKYFTTKRKKYIITDAPGHTHYTKNLVTGASNADLMIILIDARNGITGQTRMHTLVASFLNIGHVLVAINKMDIVDYSEPVYNAIKNDYELITNRLQIPNVSFIPISALLGDNVFQGSEKMNWYTGKTLMQYLEECEPAPTGYNSARFSVQNVFATTTDKVYLGKMLSGSLKINDKIKTWPIGSSSTIAKILSGYTEVNDATAGQNISLYVTADDGTKRGNIVSNIDDLPECSKQFEATICWLDTTRPLITGTEYYLRINTQETLCVVDDIICKTDITTFEQYIDNKIIEVNQIAMVRISTKDTIVYDPFSILPENGRGIIIDTNTNYTAGVFRIENQSK